MIELTQYDNQKIIINCDHIQTAISIPETRLTTFSGHSYIVKETLTEIIEKTVKYKKRCFNKQDLTGN